MPISEDGAWAIAKTSVICPQISGVESSVDLKIVIIKDSNRFDRRYGAEMHNKRMKVGTTKMGAKQKQDKNFVSLQLVLKISSKVSKGPKGSTE